jgi:hypothetical protein
MRKRVISRFILFFLVYCLIFLLLVAMQFRRTGNFSYNIGDMLVSGHYSMSDADTGTSKVPVIRRPLDGGSSVFFGGLEFQLAFSPDTDNGFSLVDSEGERRQIFPETITILENEVLFLLPGGTELFFICQNFTDRQNELPELRIQTNFSGDVSAIEIPFRLQRSSVIRENSRNILNISFNGNRYRFSRDLSGLESGLLILSTAVPAISYRAVTDKAKVCPADFILPPAGTIESYDAATTAWTGANFQLWGRNMPAQVNEDRVIAWCAEAVRQGNYRNATSVIPAGFSTSPGRTWESAVYQFDRRIGNWGTAVRAIVSQEREKNNRITQQLAANDMGIFEEKQLIEYLTIRNNNALIEEILSFARDIDQEFLTINTSPGILEAYADMNKWYPDAVNPFEKLSDYILELVSDGLHGTGDSVFIFTNDLADIIFNLRLGIALHNWGEISNNTDWAGVGRSIILSVISLGSEDGSVPVSLTIGGNNEYLASADRINSARLYRSLNENVHLPHASVTGINNIWAWTAASAVRITQNDRLMDINVSFPAGAVHYMMLRNIRPFYQLQIHDTNWRSAPDFESYNASGWYYFENDRILIIKIMHRLNTERLRIIFSPLPLPPQSPAS